MDRQEQNIKISNFRGMNLFDNHIRIPLEEAALVKNVWTSDQSGTVEMRPGCALSGLGGDKDWEVIIRGMWRYHRDDDNSYRIAYAYNATLGIDQVWVLESGTWVKHVDLVGVRRTPYAVTLSLPDNLFFLCNGTDLLLQFDGSTWESVTLGLIGGDLGTVAFTGTGEDDMTHSGRHVHDEADGYKVEIDAVDTGIQVATHVGKGLDDLTSGGAFVGVPVSAYHIKIVAIGTDGAPDSFIWSDDGGASWSAPVAATGASQALSDGVTITFGAFDGHTVNDWWYFGAGVDTYRWSDDGGATWDVEDIPIVNGRVALNKSVYIDFEGLVDHDLTDYWEFSGAVSRQLTPDTIIEVSGHLLAWCGEDPKQIWYNVVAGDLTLWTHLNFYQKASTRVTGMADFEGIPIIFTSNAMFEVTGFPQDIVVKRFASYGCFSQQCLVDMGEILMWAGRGPDGFGIYGWAGGRPQRLSKKIKTRYTEIDMANAHKCWAMAYKGNYLFFYPSVTDGTNQCSRCLVWNIENRRWYEWRDMHFACGVWENSNTDIGRFYLGSNKGVGVGNDEYYMYRLTEGAYVNPFDDEGIELYWLTGNIDCGDLTIPKEFTKLMPAFKVLGGGLSTAGYIQPFIDDVAGIQESIDESDEYDQVLMIRKKGISPVDMSVAELEDMTPGGTFTGEVNRNFVVELEVEAEPDTFRWSINGGASWEDTGIAISGAAQDLQEGITVTFNATTGHTAGDRWSFHTALDYPSGHFIRFLIFYKGTKGIRFDLFKFWYRFLVGMVNAGADA